MKTRIAILAAVLIGAFVIATNTRQGGALRQLLPVRSAASPGPIWSEPPTVRGAGLSSDELNNIEIYKRNKDATVNITSIVYRQNWFLEIYPQRGAGSGFVIRKDGLILTNHHVVAGRAPEISVTLADGSKHVATVIHRDPANDLALLKINPKRELKVLPLGDSDSLQVGQKVLAIGNPFGFDHTLTTGIISSLGREIADETNRKLEGLIQTDAAINPGNSGGALVSMGGEVIGINTAIFSRTGGSIGIGFAIPSNMVRAVVDAARAGLDYFERPFVGAAFESVDATMAEALGMNRPHGALVRSVSPDGPSAKAGLRPGDVVLALNGAAIEHPDALGYRLATSPIGSVAELTVLAQGRERTVEVELIRAPEGASTAEIIIDGRSPFAGAKVAALSPRLAQRLRLGTEARGVAIVEVLGNSPAAGFGLRPRDIVREVNGEEIDTAEKLRDIAAGQSRWWRFTIERDGRLLNQVLRY